MSGASGRRVRQRVDGSTTPFRALGNDVHRILYSFLTSRETVVGRRVSRVFGDIAERVRDQSQPVLVGVPPLLPPASSREYSFRDAWLQERTRRRARLWSASIREFPRASCFYHARTYLDEALDHAGFATEWVHAKVPTCVQMFFRNRYDDLQSLCLTEITGASSFLSRFRNLTMLQIDKLHDHIRVGDEYMGLDVGFLQHLPSLEVLRIIGDQGLQLHPESFRHFESLPLRELTMPRLTNIIDANYVDFLACLPRTITKFDVWMLMPFSSGSSDVNDRNILNAEATRARFPNLTALGAALFPGYEILNIQSTLKTIDFTYGTNDPREFLGFPPNAYNNIQAIPAVSPGQGHSQCLSRIASTFPNLTSLHISCVRSRGEFQGPLPTLQRLERLRLECFDINEEATSWLRSRSSLRVVELIGPRFRCSQNLVALGEALAGTHTQAVIMRSVSIRPSWKTGKLNVADINRFLLPFNGQIRVRALGSRHAWGLKLLGVSPMDDEIHRGERAYFAGLRTFIALGYGSERDFVWRSDVGESVVYRDGYLDPKDGLSFHGKLSYRGLHLHDC